jgi:hypothetical protein
MAEPQDYELLKTDVELGADRTPPPRLWVAAVIGVVIAALVAYFIYGRRPAPAPAAVAKPAETEVAVSRSDAINRSPGAAR